MAEKCTNTSSPLVRWINPYPFAPLNHFTVPFSRSLTVNPFRSVVAFLQLGCPAESASGRETTGTESHARNRRCAVRTRKGKGPRVRRRTQQRQAPGPLQSLARALVQTQLSSTSSLVWLPP